jgi:WD40 repeat protein
MHLMYVLKTGGSVFQLQFLPDGRRLLAGVASQEGIVNFDVLTLPDGEQVRLALPQLRIDTWWYSGYGNAVALHPAGTRRYVAWNGQLFSFRTADGTPRRVTADIRARQVVLSPAGDRLLVAEAPTNGPKRVAALTVHATGDTVVWDKEMPQTFRQVAGFLPDAKQFFSLEDVLRIRSFASGEEQTAGRHRLVGTGQPQLSLDGRHLGTIGYSSMYLFDTTTLGKPRRIAGSNNFGNFVSFAFHPDGRKRAVIHGGPTLVKIYDLETLRLTQTYRWKLGPLGAVAFSRDGMLGAAGSQDGRIVVWDMDS